MDRRRLLAAATAAAGAASIGATVLIRVVADDPVQQDAAAWFLIEPLALAVLVGAAVRWATPRAGAISGAVAATGSALWVQRFLGGPSLDAVGASATWLIPSLALGVIGWYLRWSAAERERAVAAVAAEQRALLAVDLHDFVAHDISEIVARAQAGAAVLPLGDPRVAALLEDITAAGLRALDSMDQTVRTLGAGESPARATRGGVEDIDELARRFTAAGEATAVVENALTERVEPRIGAEAYRAVVEALTNVRRHAVRATRVVIDLTQQDSRLLVSISDDGESWPAAGRSVAGGLGLAAMTERAQRLGGRVVAGPQEPRGWRVAISLPSAPREGASS